MTNLLALSTGSIIAIIVGGIVGLVLFGFFLRYVNVRVRARYGMSLWGGAFLMLLAEVLIILGIFLFKDSNGIRIGLCVVGGVLVLITLIYNIKRAGGMGILFLFLQVIFSVGCVFMVFSLFSRDGRRSLMVDEMDESYRVRRYKRRHGLDDEDNFDDIYRN